MPGFDDPSDPKPPSPPEVDPPDDDQGGDKPTGTDHESNKPTSTKHESTEHTSTKPKSTEHSSSGTCTKSVVTDYWVSCTSSSGSKSSCKTTKTSIVHGCDITAKTTTTGGSCPVISLSPNDEAGEDGDVGKITKNTSKTKAPVKSTTKSHKSEPTSKAPSPSKSPQPKPTSTPPPPEPPHPPPKPPAPPSHDASLATTFYIGYWSDTICGKPAAAAANKRGPDDIPRPGKSNCHTLYNFYVLPRA